MHHVGITHNAKRVSALIDETTVILAAIGPATNYWRNKLNPARRWQN